MSTKHQPCGNPGCINCWAPATGFDGQAAPHNPWHTEHLHPLQQTLRENGDLIAAQATIAQQAQMIEHLRGGPTPGFTAVDMATAAADGFRDGAASNAKDAERYRWLNRQRRSVWRELGAAPMNMTGELIDAAMSKESHELPGSLSDWATADFNVKQMSKEG